MDKHEFRTNNFDLIRLIAALQVVLVHGIEHFKLHSASVLTTILPAFPGVPIFFFVSGFLISASLERSSSIPSYFVNRVLRIYPGLLVCLAVSLVSIFVFYKPEFSPAAFATWIVAQASIGQFYNPDFLRGYGVGVLNGSLWTIPVELQFYLLLPVVYWILEKLRWNRAFIVVALVALVTINQIYVTMATDERTMLVKLFSVTVFPYLYMFLLGVILQRNQWFVKKYLKNRFLPILGLYVAVCLTSFSLGFPYGGNRINPVSALTLAMLMMSFAYSYTDRLSHILRGNDISYGVYIYHMVWVNAILQTSSGKPEWNLGLMLVVTLVSALLSWRFIEKPSLALKAYSIKRP